MTILAKHTVPSPLGPVLLAASPLGLRGAWFDEQAHGPATTRVAQWKSQPEHPVLQAAATQLSAYFLGERQSFDLPLDLSAGTPFQIAAWQALLQIAWGNTISYGELARRMGNASAVRAAGTAIGRNPLCIFVPCHRVIGTNGSLTGYAGGLHRKQALLQLEQHGSLL
ncbi:MAG: cysteine methyltransferase [Comamonadaceae bacterium]|nr:cysteine methyltransferase [Comamonadaceae bacterium]